MVSKIKATCKPKTTAHMQHLLSVLKIENEESESNGDKVKEQNRNKEKNV